MKLNLKFIATILLTVLILSMFTPLFYGCDSNKQVVNVFNWGEYISDSSGVINVLKEFEAETGIKVNYTTYATNEELYSKLKSSGANYDVIIPSDYMIGRMIDEDMLEKLDFNNIPNYANIMEEYKNLEFDPMNQYSVPYTWGTVVLIYNTKFVTKPVDSWDILWDEDYKGKIIMFHNSRDAFCIALKKLGYSVNTTNIKELEEAAAELQLQKEKEIVQGYYMDEIFNKMGGEEAWLAPYYAGDALTMMEDNPDLAAAYPKEGTNIFVDSMCIPKDAKNKEAAEKFINFMCKAEIAAANSEFIGYSTPNQAAYDLLDDETKNNPITYPSKEILDNTEVFLNLPEDINKKIDSLWTEIRGSSSGNIFLFPILIGGLVVVCVIILILGRRRKKSVKY
jgi:spermidine/putrescine transport system substrate-binding protein